MSPSTTEAFDAPGVDAAKDERIILIPKDQIVPDPMNPRRPDDPSMAISELDSLRESIEKAGQLIPMIVGPRGADGKFKLIAGHRRLAAIQRSEVVHTCKAMLREHVSGGERGLLEIQLLENAHRPDVSVLSDAEAVQRLVDLYDGNRAVVQGILGIGREVLSYKLAVANASESIKEFARQTQQDDLQGLYELVKLETENVEFAKSWMHQRLASRRAGGIRNEVKRLRARLKSAKSPATTGERKKSEPTPVGSRGKAPLAQKVSLDLSKGYPVLFVESKGVVSRFRLDAAGLLALRQGITTTPAAAEVLGGE